ncbi:tetratricopeptide repeat protein [Bacteriovorax sp. DB6_IX]|uniref:tetratricopeptide repeat protein n=1 Tax=Bacteriovorax sp. DB6_IX TaxID=1353530 RepID=UPI00038A19C0|nr:tetratricopeptide repeat protein [Bacteriovorax sp. DB6_IX]EQC51003.1 tetratricopeptide repeat protein [Bacteriovorax sp. DB6_IX]
MKRTLPIIALLLAMTSCKTQEQIKREQLVDSISVQMVQSQKLTADTSVKMQELEDKINKFQGVLEESAHVKEQNNAQLEERIKALEELTQALNTQLQDSNKQLNLVEKRLSEQDKFIKEILKTLKSSSKKVAKRPKKQTPYNEAMNSYKRGKYKQAIAQMQALLEKKLSTGQKKRVLHNLGMASYITKNNQDALTYFSQLYTEYPKSTYNANGLIHLARTFKRMGQVDQAKETLQMMIKSFPTHKRVGTAKKLLKSL